MVDILTSLFQVLLLSLGCLIALTFIISIILVPFEKMKKEKAKKKFEKDAMKLIEELNEHIDAQVKLLQEEEKKSTKKSKTTKKTTKKEEDK